MDKKVDSKKVAMALVKNLIIKGRDINTAKTAKRLCPLYLATLRELALKETMKN